MYDLVIRNGTVVDGSGLARYRADVAVTGNRIVSMGRVRDRGREEIDADGLVVAPGFVDLHTHMDAQVFWDPFGTCSCWHGVTTVLMGNCGFSLAPSRDGEHELVMRSIERAEDISPAAMDAGIDWTWQTFPEYLDALDGLPMGINYASMIGHSPLRAWAMGERAYEDEANDEEIRVMAQTLEEALRAGAWGFTTSRSGIHSTVDGKPVASRVATWDELARLVATMSETGLGLFEIAPELESLVGDPDRRAEVNGRLRDLAVASGVLTTWGILPYGSDWREQLHLLDSIAAAGGRAFGLSHSRGITTIMSFETKVHLDRFEEWQEIRALPRDERNRALHDPAVRARLVDLMDHGVYDPTALDPLDRQPDYDRLRVLTKAVGDIPSVNEVAAQRGVHPVEAMLDLAVESDFHQCFVFPATGTDPDDLYEVMRHPRCVMTFSDSGAHVSQIMDSSIHTQLLAHWVRDRQKFTLEEAIRMITLAPATAGGFHDRGLLREGLVADINVFDPDTIGPELPVVAHDLPAGAPRLKQRATGIKATVVAGQTVLRDGEHTGAFPGRLLRGASSC